MPVALSTNTLHFKNNQGKYTSVNVVTDTTTEQHLAAIANAGAAQVELVSDEGSAQIAAVDEKGEEVRNSFPPEYQDLIDAIATTYDTALPYSIGDYCWNGGHLYKCKIAIADNGETWTPAHWEQIITMDEIDNANNIIDELERLLEAKNLATGVSISTNYKISALNGDLDYQNSYLATSYIDITGCSRIVYTKLHSTASVTNGGIYFYDSEKQPIENSGIMAKYKDVRNYFSLETVAVPESAVYVRCTGRETGNVRQFAVYDADEYELAFKKRLDKLEKQVSLSIVESETTQTDVLYNCDTNTIIEATGGYLKKYAIEPNKKYYIKTSMTTSPATGLFYVTYFDSNDSPSIDSEYEVSSNRTIDKQELHPTDDAVWFYLNGLNTEPVVFTDTGPDKTLSEVSVDLTTANNKIVNIEENISEIETALNTKAEIDGSYSSMTVGNAEQLVATVGIENTSPYLFRSSGGSADIGDRETIQEITGGTLGKYFSNVGMTGTVTDKGITVTADATSRTIHVTGTATETGVITFVANSAISLSQYHVYYVRTIEPGHGIDYCTPQFCYNRSSNNYTNDYGTGVITSAPTSSKYTRIGVTEGAVIDYTFSISLIDLTYTFGAANGERLFANRNNPKVLALCRTLFPRRDYSITGLSSLLKRSVSVVAHKTVGFNAFNFATSTAHLIGGMEYQLTGAYTGVAFTNITGASVNLDIDEAGYFTPPSDGILTITGGDNISTCVHLVWDGEKDNTFEPYEEYVYPLDSSIELHGMPKIDPETFDLTFFGDAYKPDGTIIRKVKIIQAGSLTWTANEDSTYTATISDIAPNTENICYLPIIRRSIYGSTISNTDINIYSPVGQPSGYIIYELAEYEYETAEPYTNLQVVNDFGTEEFITPAVATIEPIVPIGHQTIYVANLRAKVEMMPDSPNGDGDYLVRQTNGINVYIPYTSIIPEPPVTDGNYILKVSVEEGIPTYTWESTET